MSATPTEGVFHLHFEGEETWGHVVPAAALAQAVEALQRAVHLLAMAYEGHEIKQRVRVTQELDRKYALLLKIPQEGGYDIPYQIGNTALKLFDPDDVRTVTQQHVQLLSAVQNGDAHTLRRLIPSAAYRRLVVSELRKMQPPPRMGLVVSIEDFRRQKLLDGRTANERIAPLLTEPTQPSISPRLAVVVGRLDALDFQARRLRLQLPNGRIVEGLYSETLLPVLLENPSQFIQVRGEAVIGEDGSLRQLNNVQEIIEVDDSKLSITSVVLGGVTRSAIQPITFDLEFNPEDGVYIAAGPFNVVESAETRPELEAALAETLAFLWEEYVMADPETLTADARELRGELQRAFGEDKNAARA
jgi:hypothetical protein